MRWWRGIDRQTIVIILMLILVGSILLAAAGPASSNRVGVSQLHFVKKQLIYAIIAIPTMLVVSSLNPKILRSVSILGFVCAIFLMSLLPIYGELVKGSKRWLNLFGISLQPSEFLKPFYLVVIATLLSTNIITKAKSFMICALLHTIVTVLLLIQPDFGTIILISMITGFQIFISGLSWLWFFVCMTVLFCIGSAAYFYFPHVNARIHTFLSGDLNASYQVQKSLLSYQEGGFLGTGPGEGRIKYSLPDSHTDFIFAVAAEEFGSFFCLLIILLSMFMVFRGFFRINHTKDTYSLFLSLGSILYLALQYLFNIGVTLNLLPTKGMILPFISYGGSALISMSIIAGIYLNSTRYNHDIRSSIQKRISYVHF